MEGTTVGRAMGRRRVCAHTWRETHSFSDLLDFYEDRLINLWISLFISTFKPVVVP